MGLDNGIIVRNIKKEDIPSSIDRFGIGNEFAYWRKCWGIRDNILRILDVDLKGEGNYILDREKLKKVIEELERFTDEEYWNKYAESVWEFDDFRESQEHYLRNLHWLYDYIENHPEVEVVFYDSY